MGYKTMKESINEVAERLVSNEVFYCVSYMVSELSRDPNYMDAILEFSMVYKDNSEAIDDLQDRIDELEAKKDDAVDGLNDYTDNLDMDAMEMFYDDCLEAIDDLFDNAIEELENDKQDLETEQDYPDEALEHWLVSDWLADKLESYGQMVTKDFLGLTIWGRSTSGQAISMDYVIQQIAKDMGGV